MKLTQQHIQQGYIEFFLIADVNGENKDNYDLNIEERLSSAEEYASGEYNGYTIYSNKIRVVRIPLSDFPQKPIPEVIETETEEVEQ